MLIDYPISCPPDLSGERFAAILRAGSSPAIVEVSAIYDALVGYRVSPALFLAIFRHESRYGTVGICAEYETKNPGNVRTPERPGAASVIDTPRGRFARYPTWAIATADWCERLLGPKYAGAGLTTVRAVLPRYAPSGDQGNSPEAYIASVLASIESWVGKGAPPVAYSKRQQLVKAGSPNRPGNLLNGNGVATAYTIHNTANPQAGANAAMHANYVGNGGGPDSSSYHDVADDEEVVQLLPYTEAGFHIGDWSTGPGWISSYGIEICENAGIDFPQACRNAARAVAERMIADGHAGEYGRVKKHGDWWTPQHPQVHKGCPARLLAGWQGVTWAGFLGMVKAATEQLQGATKVPVSPVADPGFAGALTSTGGLVINGQSPPDPGHLVTVEAIEATGRNEKDEHYSIKWEGHQWGPWRRVG